MGLAILVALVAVAAPPAEAATAVDDAYFVEAGAQLSVPSPGLLDNDCCPDRDPLTASLETPAAHGEVTVNADGSFSYQHDGLGSTSDSFQYRAIDGGGSAVATVVLTIGAVSTPEATGESYSIAPGGTLSVDPPGVLLNDYDPEGDALTAVLVSPPGLSSSFTLNADGGFTYVHDVSLSESGSVDSFTYAATDGATTSAPATVTIEISGGSGSNLVVATLSFDEVSGVELESQIGETSQAGPGSLKTEALTIVAGSVPAVGSGPGMPPQTSELRLRVTDSDLAASAREQFAACQKVALIAQARPDIYRLEVVAEVPSLAINQATGEAVVFELAEGFLTCSLHRVP
jgi:VCBS repeat-containing protein